MQRTFEAAELVQLPLLDTPSATALGRELLTLAAQERRLPAAIEKAHKRLEQAHKVLHTAAQARLGEAAGGDTRPRAADVAADGAFSMLNDWLAGLARLPDKFPEGQEARRVQSVLFADGLRFTQLPFKKQWAEADARVQRLKQDGLDKVIEQLGGRSLLQNLRETHAAYGEALGITRPLAAPSPITELREPLLGLREALRGYVLQVMSHADAEPETGAPLADRLLRPLREYAPARPAAPAASPTPPAPAPTPPA
jgi:hypothetical protein